MHGNSLWTPVNFLKKNHHHHHLIWNVYFLHAIKARIRCLPIILYEVLPHIPECCPLSQALPCHPSHILSKTSYSPLYLTYLCRVLPHRPTPNHLHAPDVQTTSIDLQRLTTSATLYTQNTIITNPHCDFYPSATLRTYLPHHRHHPLDPFSPDRHAPDYKACILFVVSICRVSAICRAAGSVVTREIRVAV